MATATKKLKKFSYATIMDGCKGICLACGAVKHKGVEPDARNYECPKCKKMQVFGLEEALMMGRIDVSGGGCE